MFHVCQICEKEYANKQSIRRHIRMCHEICCNSCSPTFVNKSDFLKHQQIVKHHVKKNDDILISMWKSHIQTSSHKNQCVVWLNRIIIPKPYSNIYYFQ